MLGRSRALETPIGLVTGKWDFGFFPNKFQLLPCVSDAFLDERAQALGRSGVDYLRGFLILCKGGFPHPPSSNLPAILGRAAQHN